MLSLNNHTMPHASAWRQAPPGAFVLPVDGWGLCLAPTFPSLARAQPQFMRLGQSPPQVHVTSNDGASQRVEPYAPPALDPQPRSVAGLAQI